MNITGSVSIPNVVAQVCIAGQRKRKGARIKARSSDVVQGLINCGCSKGDSDQAIAVAVDRGIIRRLPHNFLTIDL